MTNSFYLTGTVTEVTVKSTQAGGQYAYILLDVISKDKNKQETHSTAKITAWGHLAKNAEALKGKQVLFKGLIRFYRSDAGYINTELTALDAYIAPLLKEEPQPAPPPQDDDEEVAF